MPHNTHTVSANYNDPDVMAPHTGAAIDQNPGVNQHPDDSDSSNPPTSLPPQHSDIRYDASQSKSNADSLMDDVFGELNQLLEDTEQVRATIVPEIEHPPARTEPEPVVMPTQSWAMPLAVVPEPVQPPVDEQIASSEPPVVMPPPRSPMVDKLMVFTAIASIIATAIVGWMNRQDIQQFVASVIGQSSSSATTSLTPQTVSDLQFIDYLQRSLTAIDSTAPPATGLSIAANPTGGLSTVAVTGNLAQPPGTPTVLERIFVPVYQPPQTLYLPPNQMPTTPVNPGALAPNPGSTAPAPSVALAPSPAPVTEAVTLVGILDLGKKSAALFEVNSAPQRIHAGETIGNTGWMLVKITGQEVVIRRNGDVRSVYVGQKL